MEKNEHFEIGDFVRINRNYTDTKHDYKGVVTHVGAVKFDEGDDWIGVRMTGDSIRQLEKDGTTHERLEDHVGIYVRSHMATKRTPSKLEELRLKRENHENVSSVSTHASRNTGHTPQSITSKFNEGNSKALAKENGKALAKENEDLKRRNIELGEEVSDLKKRLGTVEAQLLDYDGINQKLSAANENAAELEKKLYSSVDEKMRHNQTVQVHMDELQSKLGETMANLEKEVLKSTAEYYHEQDKMNKNRPKWLDDGF